MSKTLQDKFITIAKLFSPTVTNDDNTLGPAFLKASGWALSISAFAILPFMIKLPTADEIQNDRKNADTLQVAFERVGSSAPFVPYTQKHHSRIDAHNAIRVCYLSALNPSGQIITNEAGTVETRYHHDTARVKECLSDKIKQLARADLPKDATEAANHLKNVSNKSIRNSALFALLLITTGAGLSARDKRKALKQQTRCGHG